MEVVIYSRDNCGYCNRAKIKLQKYNPKIHMLNIDFTRDEFFIKFPNAKTFPQIIINNKLVGGYNELEKWLAFNSPNEDF